VVEKLENFYLKKFYLSRDGRDEIRLRQEVCVHCNKQTLENGLLPLAACSLMLWRGIITGEIFHSNFHPARAEDLTFLYLQTPNTSSFTLPK
jgi:hypothetical protein